MSNTHVSINRITTTAFAISLIKPNCVNVAAFDADTMFTLSNLALNEGNTVLPKMAKVFPEIVLHEGIESSSVFFNHKGTSTIYYNGDAYNIRLGKDDVTSYFECMRPSPELEEKLIEVLSPAFDDATPDSEMDNVHVKALELMPEIHAHWANYITVCLEKGYLVKVDKEAALEEVMKATEEVKGSKQYHLFSKGPYQQLITFDTAGEVVHTITYRSDLDITIVFDYENGQVSRVLGYDLINGVNENIDTYHAELTKGEEIITGESCVITRDTNGEWVVDSDKGINKLGGDTDIKTILDLAYPSGTWL